MRWFKVTSIVVGFVLSLAGTLASFVFVNSLNGEIQAMRDERSRLVAQAESLTNVQLQYFLANQQGDMIFALMQGGTRLRADVSALLYAGNVLDRATPIRNLFGALALAGKLDYASTYEGYVKVNERARESAEMADYQALKAVEKSALELCLAHVGSLHGTISALDQGLQSLDASLRWRQTVLISLTSLGAAILLLANLMEERHTVRAKPTAAHTQAHADDGSESA